MNRLLLLMFLMKFIAHTDAFSLSRIENANRADSKFSKTKLFATKDHVENIKFISSTTMKQLTSNMITASTLSLSLFTSIVFTSPSSVIAVSTPSTDAIEVRRTMGEISTKDPLSSTSSTITLPSGVKYSDAIMGDISGPVVEEGRTVQLLWVLRRANGYFVDSSTKYNNEPFIYRVGNKQKIIQGLDEGIRGMRQGGVRRIAVPSSLAYVQGVEEGNPGPLPKDFGPKRQIITRQDQRETWNFEILVRKIK